MEKIIDYLAEEEAQEQKRKEKHARMRKLLSNIANVKPQPMNLDFLSNAFGD